MMNVTASFICEVCRGVYRRKTKGLLLLYAIQKYSLIIEPNEHVSDCFHKCGETGAATWYAKYTPVIFVAVRF